jgi:alcohol dehydrogenase, propanol-preferring
LWEGAYEGLSGQVIKTTDRGIRCPLTPGHEIAGVIESIGEDVKEFVKGDRVPIYPWIGDGLCPACRAGEENVCDNPRSLGIYSDGGYAEYVLVPKDRYLIRLDDNMDINAGAILGCSVLTAYGAVKNAMLKPNDNVIVVGVGDIGLMAIQSVKAITEARTIAMDIDD